MNKLSLPDITIIACALTHRDSPKKIIGRDHKQGFFCKEDMEMFRAVTNGSVLIMGRNTYDHLHHLDGRLHIVLTRDKDIFDDYDNLSKKAFFKDSIEDALYAAKDYQKRKRLDGRNIFVIGGEEIYKQFLPFATRILLTEIDTTKYFDSVEDFHASGNKYFPSHLPDPWQEFKNTKKTTTCGFYRVLGSDGSDGTADLEMSLISHRKVDNPDDYLAHRVAEETHRHIDDVQIYMQRCIDKLHQNSKIHDLTKFGEEELTPLMNLYAHHEKNGVSKFGTEEYKKDMKTHLSSMIKHHHQENTHHPEHFEAGVKGMNLMQVLEMVCDWASASKRSGGGIVNLNDTQKRFCFSDDMKEIMRNTLKTLNVKTE